MALLLSERRARRRRTRTRRARGTIGAYGVRLPFGFETCLTRNTRRRNEKLISPARLHADRAPTVAGTAAGSAAERGFDLLERPRFGGLAALGCGADGLRHLEHERAVGVHLVRCLRLQDLHRLAERGGRLALDLLRGRLPPEARAL